MITNKYGKYTVVEIEREVRLKNTYEVLDIMANALYQERTDFLAIMIYQESLNKDFFDLKTGLAGEMLQKFSNYNVRFSIIGDFTAYESKALADFIRECNRGGLIHFAKTKKEALSKFNK